MEWNDGIRGLAYGADYNPEQWPEHIWADDIRLMGEAGVNLVNVGIFSWAQLEPQPGVFEFGWLDRLMDLLAGGGIRADLATATASPPPWLSHLHPEILPMTADGRRLWPGSRQAWCPSSPVYRAHALELVEKVAERYRDHPALALWHISNEYGCHNAHCYCDVSGAAFRDWLRDRYGDLDGLNEAWGTSFWSQRYGSWDEILPPRAAPSFGNPTQQLDFRRFSSDALLSLFRAEKDVLRRITPDVPVTTNFMAMQFFRDVDYWQWAPEQDVVSNDHYLDASDPAAHVDLAFSADLTRGLAGGRPWLLMEHSTSAVNWQARNVAKQPGEMLRNGLQHVARGADGLMFFQWRASRAGAEKFHSAMVPHAGTDTKVWQEVVQLGDVLERIAEVRGTTVSAEVAFVFDWQSWWATELAAHPSIDVRYLDQTKDLYRAMWEAGITVDFVAPEADLSGYRLVVVPTLYLCSDGAAEELDRFCVEGGAVLMTFFSGVSDLNDHIRLGGYPGAFRDLLGIVTEEFFPLREHEIVALDDGSPATVWAEKTHLTTAEAVSRYVDGPVAGSPAVTRNRRGAGTAWYLGTSLDHRGLEGLVATILAETGLRESAPAAGFEVVRRSGPDGSYRFVINHSGRAVSVEGNDLLTGERGTVTIAAGGVAVLKDD